MNEEQAIRKVVIMGTGPAGLTAAIYAARAQLEPLVIEGLQPGGQLTITTDVENFPGFEEGISGPELMTKMRAQAERFGVEFIFDEVTEADLSVRPFRITSGDGSIVHAKTFIIASGATARYLGLESERAFMGRGVSACATCDGFFFKGKEIAVIGGGDTALEEAIYLTNFSPKVSVIHRRGELRASAIMQERAKRNEKIHFVWNSVVTEILPDAAGKRVGGVRLRNTKTNELSDFPCEGVFVAIGHEPNTKALGGQLELTPAGYIVTHDGTCTSIPGVFAAGDVQDSKYRQAVTAVGTGCMAAIDAMHFLESNS